MRRAAARSIAVAMVRVKRKHKRAWSSEGHDSRAMRDNLYFAVILIKGLPANAIKCIARRLGAISGLSSSFYTALVKVFCEYAARPISE